MNNPNFPGVDQDGSESLDLPASLAQLINMGTTPAAPQPGLQTGLPSFQEGGMIGEFSQKAANTRARNISGFIPNPVNSVRALVNLPGSIVEMYRARERGPDPSIPGMPGYKGRTDGDRLADELLGSAKGIGGGFLAAGRKEQDMDRAGAMALGNQYQGYLNNMINPPRGGGIARDERLGDQSLSMDIPSFQEGGMIGEGGSPIPVGGVPGMPMQAGVNPAMNAETPMDAQAMQMQINRVASRHPQAMAEIRNAIVEEMQSGDLTQQELNMIVQLAQLAANNPEMYPYVKQFAMQQGIAAAGDLPEQYDQGLVMVLLLAARAVQQDLGGAPAEAGQPPGNAGPVIPTMAKGGMLPNSGKSEPVIIEAHTGEYVIPKHVVDMKGKEFFDSLVEKYKGKK